MVICQSKEYKVRANASSSHLIVDWRADIPPEIKLWLEPYPHFVHAIANCHCDSKYLYHELKMLLTLEAHSNIVSAPIYIVTKKCLFGGKQGVCGFVIKHYHLGNLRDSLFSSQSGIPTSTCLQDRFRWAREVTRSLIHINSSRMGFYPDIKPDNIVLEQRDGILHAVLIDLEQRGGWYSWSSPEIAYIEYMEVIATRMPDHTAGIRSAALLRSLIPCWKPPKQEQRYEDCENGFSSAWLSLSQSEREAAQVSMLGKLLWCIFERQPSVNCALGPEIFREQISDVSFPKISKHSQQNQTTDQGLHFWCSRMERPMQKRG